MKKRRKNKAVWIRIREIYYNKIYGKSRGNYEQDILINFRYSLQYKFDINTHDIINLVEKLERLIDLKHIIGGNEYIEYFIEDRKKL